MPPRIAWHNADPADVADALGTDLAFGLTASEAADRLTTHGANQLGEEKPRTGADILLSQFTSPLIYILLVALVVTILITEYTDAAVIGAVLLINAVIGFTQERKADRSVHALMELAAPRSTVIRDGREQDIDAAALVPGDIVLLTSGSRVPADLRLVSATTLDCDESLLTGESTATRKTTTPTSEDAPVADRSSMAFMGSTVVSGRGRGAVTSTGLTTQLGAIAESIRQEKRPETPLQQRMGRFANIVAIVVLVSTAVAFFLGLALGQPVDEMFLTAVALAVAVVPEGLPVAFTVAMALGVRRMARRNAIVRSLPAVETLGSTDVIGSDKTGTLTTNRMTVSYAWLPSSNGAPQDAAHAGNGFIAFPGQDDDVFGAELPTAHGTMQGHQAPLLRAALTTAVLSNEADLVHESDGSIEHRGDPTESALLDAARQVGIDPGELRRLHPALATVPFESELRYSSVVVDEQGPVLRCKGAPERIVELCTSIHDADGVRDIDVAEVLAAADEMAHRGLRVLATAERRLGLTADQVDPEHPPEPTGLVLTGLLGLHDPPRPRVREAIQRCRSAGIRILMITGDHAATAESIAIALGIAEAGRPGLTGAAVERMTDDELTGAVLETDVFARVAPDHKLRIVRALQSHGEVVAVTGDGVNDGPALKAADIGIAMGRGGTDVAREAADIVLTDDNFVSIASAVEEGRVVFDNVRKVTYFLLSTGSASIVAIIASIAAGLPLPYVPAALLWLNVVTNGLQDVALAFEPGEPGVLDRPPRHRREGIIDRVLWERTVLMGLLMAAGSMWLFRWAIDAGTTPGEQRGAALTTLVIAMAVHAFNARSEWRSIFRTHVRGNPFLLLSSLAAIAIHLAATSWGPTQAVLQIEPVPPGGWPRIAAVAVAVVLASDAHKFLRSRHVRSPATGRIRRS